jgi:serine/threonine protein kinase
VKSLSDAALDHLREVTDLPDLTGTRYELLEKIGQGGMASVYLVRDRDLGRPVALKVTRAALPGPDAGQRLAEEARVIARLEHPGIVPVHDCGVLADGRAYYAMKFVRGHRLDKAVGPTDRLHDPLRLFEKVCQAVAFAHAHGVIHRDLKPQNVMVGPFGEVLVLDWGVAKTLADPPTAQGPGPWAGPAEESGAAPRAGTAHGTVLGTPGYMAPEQAQGAVNRIDARTDVYGLGGILYFLLTGGAPAAVRPDGVAATLPVSPRRHDPSVPRPLEAVCLKALAPAPGDRYPSAQALADDVARFLGGLRVEAYPDGPLGAARRWVARHRVAIVLVLAYLAMRGFLFIFAGP